MASKRKQRRQQEAIAAAAPPKRRGYLLPFAVGAIIAGCTVALASRPANNEIAPTPIRSASLPSLGDLAAMPSKQLEQQDLALVNLRCAAGLPGAEKLNVEQTLATLDRWASWVRRETDRHLYKFRQNPGEPSLAAGRKPPVRNHANGAPTTASNRTLAHAG